jgi:DNA-directed RNA polymerase subunit RPC12/RpoP
MPNVKLYAVAPPPPNPKGVTVLVTEGGDKTRSVFVGGGTFNYLCAKCDHPIGVNLEERQIRNLVIQCPACGQYNDTEPSN